MRTFLVALRVLSASDSAAARSIVRAALAIMCSAAKLCDKLAGSPIDTGKKL